MSIKNRVTRLEAQQGKAQVFTWKEFITEARKVDPAEWAVKVVEVFQRRAAEAEQAAQSEASHEQP